MQGTAAPVSDRPSYRQAAPWALFAFARALLITNGGLYFPQWLVIENHQQELSYNTLLALVTVGLLFTAPFFGALADQYERKTNIKALWITSSLMFVFTMVLWLSAQFMSPSQLRIAIALTSFFVISYSFQLGFLFYHPILAVIAPASWYGRVSGGGQA